MSPVRSHRAPAVVGRDEVRRVGLRAVVVLFDDRGSPDEQFAERLAVPGDRLVVVVDDPHFKAGREQPLFRPFVEFRLAIGTGHRRGRSGDRADTHRLGHPHACSIVTSCSSSYRRITSRGAALPADDDPLQRGEIAAVLVEVVEHVDPDGGHARRERHALGLDQLDEVRGVRGRSRIHLFRAGHRHGVGELPRVYVKHGNDGHHHVVLGDVERGGRHHHHRVGVDHLVRVLDALRLPRGAGGVTHPGRVVLRERRPRFYRVGVRDQLLERRERQVGLRLRHRITHDDDLADAVDPVPQSVERRDGVAVDDQHVVRGVVDDVLDVVVL